MSDVIFSNRSEQKPPLSDIEDCAVDWHREFWFHYDQPEPGTICMMCEATALRHRVVELEVKQDPEQWESPENRIESILLAMRAYNPAASDQMRAHLNGLRSSRRRLAARSGQARDALRNGEIDDAFGLLEEGEEIWRDIIAGEDRISSLWLDKSDGIEPWQLVAIVGLMVAISYIAMMVLAS